MNWKLGMVVTFTLSVYLFYMVANSKAEKDGKKRSESAQSNVTLTGSTVTSSMIDASATTYHHNRGLSGKYTFAIFVAIFLMIAVIAGTYFFYHRHDNNCSSGSNGPAVANGDGSQAISGNCNGPSDGRDRNSR